MIKMNLLKTVMLGLCMATLTTGSAYATLADPTPSATEEVSEATKALYAKQGEIDKILFENNGKEIEQQGFMVNYTSVVEDVIEIGISPYNEDNANYIYELVGKDGIKVIEFDQSILYATGVAPDAATGEVTTDAQDIMDKEETVVDTNAGQDAVEDVADDDKVQIQIESIDDDTNSEEKVYKNTSVDGKEVQTISAPEETAKEDAPTLIVILAIVGGAALVGGAVLLSNKKKTSK